MEGEIIKLKSDEELISLACLLQEETGGETFSLSDLILKAAVIGELEVRGYIIKEVLRIERSKEAHYSEPALVNNQDEGGDEGEKESKEPD